VGLLVESQDGLVDILGADRFYQVALNPQICAGYDVIAKGRRC
jgi:hypothetical protein